MIEPRCYVHNNIFDLYLIIYQLPKFIQQFNNGKVIVVLIADLLDLFTQKAPNIDRNEAIFIIKEIINSIKKTLDNILVMVSFQPLQQQHNNKSCVYNKILLPRFNKHIEITRVNSNGDSRKINTRLDVKIYNKNCSKKIAVDFYYLKKETCSK